MDFFCLTKYSVTAAGPSRNRTGFPVRRPSHRSGRPPTPNSNFRHSIVDRKGGQAVRKMRFFSCPWICFCAVGAILTRSASEGRKLFTRLRFGSI